ncbi:amidohydrolase family protein [Massilia sp. 9096]|uniref:amidohydrolase family protein n=1 Tax=Massilia sp. 9096 TaxID=1500894 RepID=UPI00056911BF|nr:amidohydrolase family protein [Massilia sp. 9096]
MKLIGIEEHYLTPDVGAAWRALGLDASNPMAAYDLGPMAQRLMDMGDRRIALMDETGLDVQVLSLTTPALHELGPDSVDLARRVNDAVAEAVARHPTRFQAFATLPVAAPEAAAQELERCVKTLGFKGTMLCGRVGTRNLDHPDLACIFAAAAELHVPILLHPRTPDDAVSKAYYSGFNPELDLAFANFGMGWHYDAGVQFVRLVLAGTFDRHPDLQVILGHWGEMVLFFAERLAAMDRFAKLQQPITSYFKRNLYVTSSGMFMPHYLQRALEVVRPERLLFSTDYPYQYKPGGTARRFLDACGLEGDARAGFASANWERLTGAAIASA